MRPRRPHGRRFRRRTHTVDSQAPSTTTPSTAPSGQSYLPALDGLRALAVIAVIVYHARPDWLPGGFLGVDVFFAISGFIITRTLLVEWQQTRSINIGRFYLRRARRLLPAVALVIVAVLAFALAFHPGEVARLRLDALAAAAYVINWRFVLAQQSYFELFARPSELRHLWSLAVEEQFYLVWPLVLAVGLKLRKPRLLALPVVLLAAGSCALMALLYTDAFNTSRLYYGTDTRAAGLLIGAALALLLGAGAPEVRLSWWKTGVLDLLGVGVVASLVAAVVLLNEAKPFLYHGGFGLVALASSFLILMAVNQRGVLSRLLSLGPLRWIGQRSYGIYLWHWPLALITWPRLPTTVEMLAEVATAFALAAVSYRLIEQPVRQGSLGRLFDGIRGRTKLHAIQRTAAIFTAVGTTTIVVGLAVLLADAKPPEVPDYLAAGSVRLINVPESPSLVTAAAAAEPEPVQQAEDAPPEAAPVDATPPEAQPLVLPATTSIAISQPDALQSTAAVPPPPPGTIAEPAILPPAPAAVYLPEGTPLVTAIGDSVMLGAAPQMAARIPHVDIDAAISRQTSQAIRLLWDRLQEGSLGQVVVVSIGNNGTFTDAQFDQIMEIAGPTRRVIFVSNKVPRRWEQGNNAVIANGVRRHPNAVLVDWHAEGEARPDFFTDDGVHLRPEGANAFGNLVAAAIRG